MTLQNIWFALTWANKVLIQKPGQLWFIDNLSLKTLKSAEGKKEKLKVRVKNPYTTRSNEHANEP